MKYYPVCDDCAEGKGQECHTPSCAYCWQKVPPKMSFPEFGVNAQEVHDALNLSFSLASGKDKCEACGKKAPLIDGECPDCRH